MKRIMIVDDELLVRVGLKSMLAWEEKGYSIVGEAVDGEDAVAKLGQYAPDILLTDLVMEPMNGLELIKHCAERHPEIKIVVLSNYNDFEKVKTAMKFGARDFLFKLATSSSELLAILDGLSKEIDRERLTGRSGKDAELLLNRNAGAIRQRLIDLMSESNYGSEEDLLRELELVDVKCDFGKPYVVLYLAVANYHALEALGPVSEHGMLAVSLENVVAEILEGHFASQTFRQENGRCIVVLNPEGGRSDEGFQKQLAEVFQRIGVCGERYFGMKIRGALSREGLGVRAFSGAAADCKRTLREAFLVKENRLLLCPRERKPPKELRMPPDFRLSDWRIDLEHFQFQAAEGFIARVLEHFYGSEAEPRLIRERLYELYWVLKNDGLAKGIATDSLVDGHGLSLSRPSLNTSFSPTSRKASSPSSGNTRRKAPRSAEKNSRKR